MRPTLISHAIGFTVALLFVRPATPHGQSVSPAVHALAFFDRLPQGDISAALRAIRPRPITSGERTRVRAMLSDLRDLRPTAGEAAKLQALQAVLVYHERQDVFDIRLIDVPQAAVGLHARAMLLISRPALQLLSAAELQAVSAHEMAHEALWGEYELTRQRRDVRARHQLELQCDGIAALTLLALGAEPRTLGVAVRKLIRLNERLGATADAPDYPTPRERERFVAALLERRGG